MADITKQTHVAPYPGFFPLTLPTIHLSQGLVYWSSLSVNFSFHPSPYRVIWNQDFWIFSSEGDFLLNQPALKNSGYWKIITKLISNYALPETKTYIQQELSAEGEFSEEAENGTEYGQED